MVSMFSQSQCVHEVNLLGIYYDYGILLSPEVSYYPRA